MMAVPDNLTTGLYMSNRKGGTFRIVVIIILIVAAIAAAICGYGLMQRKQTSEEADKVLTTMKVLIPGLGVDTDEASSNGRDPLSVMTVEGVDIVGCLEIPAIDVMVPVTAKGTSRKGFVSYLSGSPVKGKFRLSGSRTGIFSDLAKVKPDDRVIFTDADGVRYRYSVLTQFHLKKWDKADYDIMLTYKVDDDTRFVVGCNRTV